ncbi:hypothetical protein AB0M31_01955 [Streptomyces sp. NPDC051773]|uniref:hypothetical protein n=1 Tax=Streptomyces sp. NPDC051773 TaxID=3156682 RepID=UPI003431953B
MYTDDRQGTADDPDSPGTPPSAAPLIDQQAPHPDALRRGAALAALVLVAGFGAQAVMWGVGSWPATC